MLFYSILWIKGNLVTSRFHFQKRIFIVNSFAIKLWYNSSIFYGFYQEKIIPQKNQHLSYMLLHLVVTTIWISFEQIEENNFETHQKLYKKPVAIWNSKLANFLRSFDLNKEDPSICWSNKSIFSPKLYLISCGDKWTYLFFANKKDDNASKIFKNWWPRTFARCARCVYTS